ncbi:MAG TPA: type II toxin-antitoxin system RelE/ParE family toxin [Pyrinomonadaceae bacterium]|nr:type II toxin-antitoxin system RelE/ParE family toxin [Pyrinomonadaceae bacterium]
MKLRFLAIAETEQAEAAAYYEAQSSGLGLDFARELRKTAERILRHPYAWANRSRRTRSCRVKRFPYSYIYRIDGDEILVVALHAHSRDPKRWQDRLSE